MLGGMLTSAEVLSPPPANQCWRCRGEGVRMSKRPRDATTGASQGASAETCQVCAGKGFLARAPARTTPRATKIFPGWKEVGPPPATNVTLASSLGPFEEVCYLTGRFRVIQRTDAHRYSTDDLVTAWAAWRAARVIYGEAGPRLACDIGCGLGSVLLSTAWLHPHTIGVGAEAQTVRADLAERNILLNGLSKRVKVVRGDLRDINTHVALASAANELIGDGTGAAGTVINTGVFDLVTGTPPYFDVSAGGLPPHEESARCLFEYRGGIEAYSIATHALLSRTGIGAICETSLALTRAYAAAIAAHLRIIARIDVIPRDGKPPLFFVLIVQRDDAPLSSSLPHAWANAFGTKLPLTALPYDDMREEEYETAFLVGRTATEDRVKKAHEKAATCAHADKSIRQVARGAHVDAVGKPLLTGSSSSSTGGDHNAQEQEIVHRICVRDAFGERTNDYARLLWELGKPS